MLRYLKLLLLFAALLMALGPPGAAAQVTKTFCVDGQSDGQGWTWSLSGIGLPAQQVTTDGVPAGGNATALAQQWVRSIQAVQGDPPGFRARFERTNADGKAYFSITADRDFTFGVDDCTITGNPNGCSFNPTVLEVASIPDDGGGLSLLLIIIIIVIVVIVVIVIVIIIRRRSGSSP